MLFFRQRIHSSLIKLSLCLNLISIDVQASGHWNSPSSIACCISVGFIPSTLQPTALQVPRTSFTVPLNSFAKLLLRIWRAMLKIVSLDRLPLCLIFFVFLRSRFGSLSSLMTKLVAFGSTSTFAARFWIVSLTVTRIPFHADVPLTMSSPTFFGDIPSGPTLGASTDDGAVSPPYCRKHTILTSFGSNLGAILSGRY